MSCIPLVIKVIDDDGPMTNLFSNKIFSCLLNISHNLLWHYIDYVDYKPFNDILVYPLMPNVMITGPTICKQNLQKKTGTCTHS